MSEEVKVEKTPARAWAILAVTYLASVVAPMCQFKVPPLASWIIPSIIIPFTGIDDAAIGTWFGLLMSAVTIIGVILSFFVPFLARTIGLKTTVLVSVACLCLGNVIAVFTDAMIPFIIGRFLEGVGIGLVGVAAPSCIAIWFPMKTRGTALGIWATWVPLGIIIAFNVSPSVAVAFGYKAVFIGMAVLCAIAFILFAAVFTMPEGVKNAEGVEGTIGENFKLLKNGRMWVLGFIFFFFNAFTVGIVGSFYNVWLESIGFTSVAAGALSGAIYIFPLFMAPICGAISDHLPVEKRWIPVAVTMVVLFIDVLFFCKTGSPQMVLIWIFIVFSGITGGACAGTCRPLAPIVMGGTPMGSVMGMSVLQFMQNLGSAIAAPLFGAMYVGIGWYPAALATGIPCTVICFILAFFIFPRKKAAKAV